MFDLVDNGERIIITRGKKKAYTIIPISDDALSFTPELSKKYTDLWPVYIN